MTTETLTRLHGRLTQEAAASGLLDVAYRTVDSPYGQLLVATTPSGVVRLAFEREGHDAVLTELATRVSPRVLESRVRTDTLARELDEYFAGRRSSFDLPVDPQLVRGGFRRLVIEHLSQIRYGVTESYAEVARELDNPGATRAVGTACATNPIPVIVPCHRVVRTDGTLGNYRGGPAMKRALLAMEQGR